MLRLGLGPLYSEDANHEESDLITTTVPYKLAMERWKQVTQLMQENDKELLDGLTKAGLRLHTGPDGTGIFAKSAAEGGGFYIDVGCAELLIDGHVQVKYANLQLLEDEGIVIEHIDDGRIGRIPCDMLVLATGYDTMDSWVRDVCGDKVAEKVGCSWGLGLGHSYKDPGPWEGELRNMFKPTNVENLWFQGGNLAQSRHYSKFIALQLAARFHGTPTPVYGIPKAVKRNGGNAQFLETKL